MMSWERFPPIWSAVSGGLWPPPSAIPMPPSGYSWSGSLPSEPSCSAFSWMAWTIIDRTIGLRVSVQAEQMGQDVAELGMESYPEFVLMPENFDDE